MKRNSTGIVIVIIIIIIIIILIVTGAKKRNNLVGNNSQTPTSQNNNVGVLFSSSPLAQNAYLISTDTYDASTQTALTGFNVTKNTLADGSMQITLSSQNTGFQTQTYTVKPGEKLYFIESMPGDDKNNTDRNLGDEGVVLVDANGYIVSQ